MAKFKVGDKVKYIGRKHGAPYGKILTVVKEPDGIGRYIVRWDSDHKGFMAVGSEGFATEAELASVNAARSRNAYAVDKKGRPIKSGMMLKDDDGDKFYVERVLRGNVVEDEWGNQHLETNRWAEIVQNSVRSRNAVVQKAMNATARNGAMAALDSSEKSKIKSIASGMPCSFMDGGDSLSGVIKHSKRPFLYIDFDVSKSEIDGKPYYEWYVHAWNRTRKWERNGGQYKIEDAVSAATQAMRGAKQMIEKWAGGVPLNACAKNADFKVGDVVGLKIMDGGRRDYVIYEVLPDSYRLCYADDFGAGCERVKKWPSDEFVDKHRRIKIPTNADTSVLRETAVNSVRTTNAVVAKALNVSHKRRS